MVSISGYEFKSLHSLLWCTPRFGSRSILFLPYSQPLSQIIDRHSLSHSEFADDSQLYNSAPREYLRSLISNMQSCVADVKVCMTQNKLQVNNEKTEALLIDPQNSPNLPLSVVIGDSEIQFSKSVRNLGVIFGIQNSTYLELRKISSVRHVLTVEATKTLVTSLVLSLLEYCNFCQECPNSSSKNFKRFKIVLPESFSKPLNALMLHHS